MTVAIIICVIFVLLFVTVMAGVIIGSSVLDDKFDADYEDREQMQYIEAWQKKKAEKKKRKRRNRDGR